MTKHYIKSIGRGQPDHRRTIDLTHTHEWDRRSLGLFEANILRAVWGPHADHFVTHDSSNSQPDPQDLGENTPAV